MEKILQFTPAKDHLHLVSPTVRDLLQDWKGSTSVKEILVAEIDPAFAGGHDFCTYYGIPESEGATCVIVEAIRGEISTKVACVAPVGYRMDFNGIIRRTLKARRVSLAPVEEVLHATKMEYGSITPVGLPEDWIILLDEKAVKAPRIVVGSGLVRAKLSLPGKALAELPNTQIVVELATQKPKPSSL